jgi:creatinine amidohydrolase
MHGGELETSLLLHVAPELVGDNHTEEDVDAAERPHLPMLGVGGYSKTGIVGRPSLASAVKGRAVLEALTAEFAAHRKHLPGPAQPC